MRSRWNAVQGHCAVAPLAERECDDFDVSGASISVVSHPVSPPPVHRPVGGGAQ